MRRTRKGTFKKNLPVQKILRSPFLEAQNIGIHQHLMANTENWCGTSLVCVEQEKALLRKTIQAEFFKKGLLFGSPKY